MRFWPLLWSSRALIKRGRLPAAVPVRRRKELERALEQAPRPPAADPDREQVRTPAPVAADLLWLAHEQGEIVDREVLDLGCGTGIFSLGAALLGARRVVGVDADGASVAVARELLESALPGADASFVEADLSQWHPDPCDTVVMNPPFGAQRAARRGDRVFYDRAAEALRLRHGAAWFLQQPVSERFLAAYARDLGAEVEKVAEWDYPLEAAHAFHRQETKRLSVGGYRMAF